MTIVVDWGVKPQPKQIIKLSFNLFSGKETKKEETAGKDAGPKSDSLCSLL